MLSIAEVANSGDLTRDHCGAADATGPPPTDSDSWAALGSAYIQQARITGQPDYYAKASGALDRSLEESPDEELRRTDRPVGTGFRPPRLRTWR
ncbi:MAG: hypothetical protein WKF73_20865 [Nocardioidaceae bacterium]